MNIIYKDSTESTNSDAKSLARDGANEWTIVCARRQSSGRGRLGRTFFSPEGGLYMSIILRPTLKSDAVTLLTTAAAAAMSRAIEKLYNKRTNIKWVNDIFIDGRKVCGILTESAFCGKDLDFAVVGIGVNLYGKKEQIPNELANIMGFVCDSPTQREELILTFLEFFREYYEKLADKPHLEYYKQKQIIKDTPVTVLEEEKEITAFAKGIDDNFHLCVETDGQERFLSFGEVSVRL